MKEDNVNKDINDQIELATDNYSKLTKDPTFTTKVRQLLKL